MELAALGHSALIIMLHMSVFFILALLLKNNGIVDIAWGLGFIFITLYTFFSFSLPMFPQVVLTILVLLWGIRLTTHIFFRNMGKGEDPRYAKWRKEWGKSVVIRSFFQVFVLQGIIMYFVALPIVFTNSMQLQMMDYLVWFGLIVWVIGFLFETIGDWQLRQFLKNPKNHGQLMTKGLWRYTRHPNYFGEATMWWGIWLISMSSPFGLVTIISPVLLTFLLLKVSGVPMTEARWKKKPGFAQYKKTTSEFFPWFPKDVK